MATLAPPHTMINVRLRAGTRGRGARESCLVCAVYLCDNSGLLLRCSVRRSVPFRAVGTGPTRARGVPTSGLDPTAMLTSVGSAESSPHPDETRPLDRRTPRAHV